MSLAGWNDLEDFPSFTAHEECLLPVSDPYPTVGNHASLQLELYVHDNLGDYIEHMDVDADNQDCRNDLPWPTARIEFIAPMYGIQHNRRMQLMINNGQKTWTLLFSAKVN